MGAGSDIQYLCRSQHTCPFAALTNLILNKDSNAGCSADNLAFKQILTVELHACKWTSGTFTHILHLYSASRKNLHWLDGTMSKSSTRLATADLTTLVSLSQDLSVLASLKSQAGAFPPNLGFFERIQERWLTLQVPTRQFLMPEMIPEKHDAADTEQDLSVAHRCCNISVIWFAMQDFFLNSKLARRKKLLPLLTDLKCLPMPFSSALNPSGKTQKRTVNKAEQGF